jgi:hypothetical protein
MSHTEAHAAMLGFPCLRPFASKATPAKWSPKKLWAWAIATGDLQTIHAAKVILTLDDPGKAVTHGWVVNIAWLLRDFDEEHLSAFVTVCQSIHTKQHP